MEVQEEVVGFDFYLIMPVTVRGHSQPGAKVCHCLRTVHFRSAVGFGI